MRFTFSFIGLLLLPLVVGCEGNTPRRSPLAPTSVPTAAKEVAFVPKSKNTLPDNSPNVPPGFTGDRPARGNAGQPEVVVIDKRPKVPLTAEKLQKRRDDLQYHSAIFDAEEQELTGQLLEPEGSLFARLQQPALLGRIGKAMKEYRALNGKPPQSLADFLDTLKANALDLPMLQETQYYVYANELAKTEASDVELEYLRVGKIE